MSSENSSPNKDTSSISTTPSSAENHRQSARKSTAAPQVPSHTPKKRLIKRAPLSTRPAQQDPVRRFISRLEKRVTSDKRSQRTGVGRGKSGISMDAYATIQRRQLNEEREFARREARRRKQARPRRRGLRGLRDIEASRYIQRAPFLRAIRDCIRRFQTTNLKIEMIVVEILQESVESFLIDFYERSYRLTTHAKRVTLFPKDMHLAKKLDDTRIIRERLANYW